MSFGFVAAGRNTDVLAQLATVHYEDDSLAGEVRDLIRRHIEGATSEHTWKDSHGTEFAQGYIIEASGHSGHGSMPSLTIALKNVYFPVVPAEAAGDHNEDEPAADAVAADPDADGI